MRLGRSEVVLAFFLVLALVLGDCIGGCSACSERGRGMAASSSGLSLGCSFSLDRTKKVVFLDVFIVNNGKEPCFLGGPWGITETAIKYPNGLTLPGFGRGTSYGNQFSFLPPPSKAERSGGYRIDRDVFSRRIRWGTPADIYHDRGAVISVEVDTDIWRCSDASLRPVTLRSTVQVPHRGILR